MKKLKLNKYQKTIEAEVDLHGLTEREAEQELYLFLREAVASRQTLLRIVTGKGLHSKDGRPIVKEMTIDVLKTLNLHFRLGKPNEGGEGAIIVDLAK